jgi:N6-adenosine-specific RNA methylase IME4
MKLLPDPVLYRVVLADPAWAFEDKARAGGRGAICNYATLTVEEIQTLPVGDLAAKSAALLLWVPASLLPVGIATIRRWSFEYKTVAFVWHKLARRKAPPAKGQAHRDHFGMGHWTRQQTELCLLGTRGGIRPASRSVRQLITAPVREHSRKPDEQYARIEQLFGDVPRVELFARQQWTGWDYWGLETSKFGPHAAGL